MATTKTEPKKASRIHKGKKQKPFRGIVYGVQGVGKSTFAASFPNALFVPTEDGLDHIDCNSYPVAESLNEFAQNLEEVKSEDFGYDTLVIDSLSALEALIWQQVCIDKGKKSFGDFDYGKGYDYALTYWKKILREIDKIRNQKKMHVVLVAHAEATAFSEPGIATYDKYAPRLHKKACPIVLDWGDAVLFANYKAYYSTEKGGFGKERNVAVDGELERFLYCQPNAAYMAKNRYGLPAELPLDFNALSEAISANA